MMNARRRPRLTSIYNAKKQGDLRAKKIARDRSPLFQAAKVYATPSQEW
jgi:hypothetical protein